MRTGTVTPRQLFSSLKLWVAFAFTVPAIVMNLAVPELNPVTGILVYGMAIVAAAFILLWAGEAAQHEVASGLAIAALAIVAVLPEYAVDLYFAFVSGSDPSYTSYAAANMTGSNRLLLGFGWPAVLMAAYLAWRFAKPGQSKDPDIVKKPFAIKLDKDVAIDLGVLLASTVLTLIVPLTGQIHIGLSAALLLLFSWYLYRMSQGGAEEPELHGMSAKIAGLSKPGRRVIILALFVVSAAVILFSAEPFAHSLVEGGKILSIDDFLLVQWLAPLASEAPEFLLAFIMAFSGRSAMAIGVLIASKVNQWTLLVGSLPIAHLIGGGDVGLAMDARQIEEFTLTAMQTILGIQVLTAMRFSGRWATALFVLFAATFVFPGQAVRWWIAGLYLAIAVLQFVRRPKQLWQIVKAPYLNAAVEPEKSSVA